MERVGRPYSYFKAINEFNVREPGLTHPDNELHIRLTDRKTIEVIAKPGLGIILDAKTNSITMVADNIQFITNDKNGLKWNDLSFNPKGTIGDEPTFVKMEPEDFHDMYSGFEDYLED